MLPEVSAMREAPGVRFLKTGPGVVMMLALSAAALVGTIAYVRRAREEERRERPEAVWAEACKEGCAPMGV
jgi:hypothetical protein